MPAGTDRVFLDFSAKKLAQLSSRIAECVGKLKDDEVWARGHENENAIGNLVLHLNGNVRQWIVTGLGGATDVRDRDSEFAQRDAIPRDKLLVKLRETLREADATLAAFDPDKLLDLYRIQGLETSALDAILHVVEHFAMHAGQVIVLTKLLIASDLHFYDL